MNHFIRKPCVSGLTVYLNTEEGLGKDIAMDVEILRLDAGQSFTLLDEEKETAILVIKGSGMLETDTATFPYNRNSQFSEAGACVHVCADVAVNITAQTYSVFYIQKAVNTRVFDTAFYSQQTVQNVVAGDHGELNGTMRRTIRTYFDYRNAPYSNLVLGEVVNGPGLWSSYPPHHHPQPEVYFYQFDKPQGFGAGYANDTVYKTENDALLVIKHGFHSQVTAPGYAMCYVWGIRHLPDNPWLNTRIDDEEHRWMLSATARAGFYRD